MNRETKTKANKAYEQIWLELDPTTPLISQIPLICTAVNDLAGVSEKAQRWINFIERVKKIINSFKGIVPGDHRVFDSIRLIGSYAQIQIEAITVAKALVDDAKLKYTFGRGNLSSFMIYLPAVGSHLIICDGCNVHLSMEHRCHGAKAKVHDEWVGEGCQCYRCLENKIFSDIKIMNDPLFWDKVRLFESLPEVKS